MSRHWLCIACRSACVDRPLCQHLQDHIKAEVDSEKWLWWRWRVMRKPAPDREAIAAASNGLRHDPENWDRVKKTLTQKAHDAGHTFVVV